MKLRTIIAILLAFLFVMGVSVYAMETFEDRPYVQSAYKKDGQFKQVRFDVAM